MTGHVRPRTAARVPLALAAAEPARAVALAAAQTGGRVQLQPRLVERHEDSTGQGRTARDIVIGWYFYIE